MTELDKDLLELSIELEEVDSEYEFEESHERTSRQLCEEANTYGEILAM